MDLLAALATPFALLLVLAGVDKLRSPQGARDALRLVGAPTHPVLVRGLPTVEIVAGAAFVVAGGRLFAGALLLAYLGFAIVVARSLVSASGASCGCFGADSSELTALHLAVDVAAVAVFGAAFAAGVPSPVVAVVTSAWQAPAVVLGSAVAAWLLRALLTDLPPLLKLARRTEVPS